jgi:hypothetical protein
MNNRPFLSVHAAALIVLFVSASAVGASVQPDTPLGPPLATLNLMIAQGEISIC